MGLFRRRRRRDVGTFEPPAPVPPPPLEHLVGEGLLIAESAVRMALKNRIIVQALRDRADFDRVSLGDFAAATLREVAAQEDEYAERLHRLRDRAPLDPFADWGEDEPSDAERAERRESLHRALAERLHDFAADDDALDALIDASRSAAWDEIEGGLVARAVGTQPKDDRYETDRAERMAALVAVDLTGLAIERGVDPAGL